MKLATLQDSPTHQLSIKLDDGNYKVIYLRHAQAESILKNINSKEQFIVIENESHPKFACRVTKLTKRDMDELDRKYKLAAKLQNKNKEEEEQEKKIAFENKKREEVKNWCIANPEKAREYMVQAEDKLRRDHPMFSALGESRIGLVKCEARKMIRSKELIRLDLSAQDHGRDVLSQVKK